MKYSSSINSEGQITIPEEIRKRLGITAGDAIDFVIEEGRTLIFPSNNAPDPFEKSQGVLGPFPGGEAGIKKWIEDMRNDEE